MALATMPLISGSFSFRPSHLRTPRGVLIHCRRAKIPATIPIARKIAYFLLQSLMPMSIFVIAGRFSAPIWSKMVWNLGRM